MDINDEILVDIVIGIAIGNTESYLSSLHWLPMRFKSKGRVNVSVMEWNEQKTYVESFHMESCLKTGRIKVQFMIRATATALIIYITANALRF